MAAVHVSAGFKTGKLDSDQARTSRWAAPAPALLFRLADFGAVLAIPMAGSLLRQSSENLQRNLLFWTLLAFVTVLLTASHGGYRAGRPACLRKHTALAIHCFLATSMVMLSIAVLLGHAHILARRWTVADLVLTPLVIAGARAVVANAIGPDVHLTGANGLIVISYDELPHELMRAIADQQIGPGIAGVLYLEPNHQPGNRGDWPELSDMQALLAMLQAGKIQDVIFVYHPALDHLAAGTRQELLAALLAFPARIWMAFDVNLNLPDILKSRSGSCRIVPLLSENLVSSLNPAKRLFDLVGSAALLLILAPLLVLTAGLVRASGPGPVIFRQSRTGAHGRQFTVLKFRTMIDEPGRPFLQAVRRDQRVTRLGRFLRRTSLDEMLQLFNVLRGDMSLVGPRPHAPETEVEGMNFENAVRLYRLRHRVKPGITGLAQIRGQRGETSELRMLEQRLASDLEYIQSWSLWLDVAILCQTLPVLFWHDNAY